jgi:ATP synthase protein I
MNSMLFKHQPAGHIAQTEQDKVAENWQRKVHLGIRLEKSKSHLWQDRICRWGGFGWAIIVPTALGAVLGLWLDTLWPSVYSWFHILFPIGAFIGCVMAVIWGYQEPGSNN